MIGLYIQYEKEEQLTATCYFYWRVILSFEDNWQISLCQNFD